MSKTHTVVVVLEAKPGNELDLETELKKVANFSRAESTNVEYRLHKGIDNPRQFILYENWESKEKHQAQFEKAYIKDFVSKLGALLAKTYEAYLGEEIT